MDEALSDLVAAEGVVQEEGCLSLVFVIVVGASIRRYFVLLTWACPRVKVLFSSSDGRGAWSFASSKSRALID